MQTAISAFLGLLAVQQAAANYPGGGSAVAKASSSGASQAVNWMDAPKLPSCSCSSYQCSDTQKSGLDFSHPSIPEGPISNYGGFNIAGASCGSFQSMQKRNLFMPRGGSAKRNGATAGKCVQGQASKQSGPKISCGGSTQPFTISHVEVSVEVDVKIQLSFGYADGSQCTQDHSCGKDMTNVIPNTQCGGATSVTHKIHPDVTNVQSCNVGIHNVGFQCTPCSQSSAPVSHPSSTHSPPETQSTPHSPTKPSESKPPKESHPSTSQPPKESKPSESKPSESKPPKESTKKPPMTHKPSRPAVTVPGNFTISTAPETQPNSPQSVTALTVPIVTSEIVFTTVTSCPVTKTHTTGSTTSVEVTTSVSTVLITSTKTICTKCVAPPKTSVPAPPASSPAVSSPNSPVQPPSAPASSPAVSSPNSPIQPSSAPVSSAPGTTQEVVTTEVVYTTVTTCPVTNIITSAGHTTPVVTHTVSTVTSTSVSTICTKCVAPPASSAPAASSPNSPVQPSSAPAAPPASSASAASSPNSPVQSSSAPAAPPASSAPAASSPNSPVQPSSAPAPPVSSPVRSSAPAAPSPSAPGVLPSCLKTWMSLTKCMDNSDSNCFCEDSGFTSNVQQCISSWSTTPQEHQQALSYLAGICAPHIPANPGLILNIPSTITLAPTPMATPPASSAPAAPAPTSAPGSVPAAVGSPAPVASAPAAGTPAPSAPAAPVTTVSISTTVTLPCPSGASSAAVSQIGDGQIQAGGSSMAAGCITTQVINTAVTVPQVAFTTGASSSVGLVAGTPAPAAASPTGNSVVNSPVQGTPAGSQAAPAPTNSSPVTPFTGAAAKVGQSGVLLSVVLAAAGFAVLA